MCKILMSIKPEVVKEILSGRKKYEYRKIKAKKNNFDKMLIYATYPIMRVVGEVDIIDIIEGEPEKIWNITSKYSGISKDFYDKYYNNKKNGVAYKIGNVKKYNSPKRLEEFGINYYPQSFVYID